MTVNVLIQIDKLVQLLESPVFTCMWLSAFVLRLFMLLFANCSRSPPAALGTRQASPPLQVPLWVAHVAAPVIRLRRSQKSSEQRQFDWLPSRSSTKTVRSSLIFENAPQPATFTSSLSHALALWPVPFQACKRFCLHPATLHSAWLLRARLP